jgi:HAD superfamily hydrolase (TIGR01509 family)
MLLILAVVFDMDGLMVDTEPLARQSWNMVLGDYGRELDEATYNQMVGLRRQESATLVIEALDLKVNPAELLEQKEHYYVEIMADGAPPMPGLHRLVGELADRGMPWAVATSSPRSNAQQVLQQLGLSEMCRAVAAGDEVLLGKPAPDVYLLAAERLGIPPESCLAFEDSVPGARAAMAAGMLTVAVPNGPTNNADDFDFVDYVFPSLDEVADSLDQIVVAKRD